VDRFVDRCRRSDVSCRHAAYPFRSPRAAAERVLACQGKDPPTGREIRFRKTCKTERAAQIELGKRGSTAILRILRSRPP
jgi:hypothetical protein